MRKSLPNPFPIPMFRKYTQQNLENKKFTNDDRRHIISVLGHNVVAHMQKASAQDCRDVAEALVMKYPFLVESVSEENFHFRGQRECNSKYRGLLYSVYCRCVHVVAVNFFCKCYIESFGGGGGCIHIKLNPLHL